MSDRSQEPELRARFEELRREDARRAPSFAAVMARAQTDAMRAAGSPARRESRVTLRRLGWAGGLAAAAAIAALIVIPRARSGEDTFEQAVQAFHANPALGAWRSPTDGLLNLPGSQLISTIPSVGTGQ
jgi:ferric-dicitrate binding protein FerR (iron transport regulator)